MLPQGIVTSLKVLLPPLPRYLFSPCCDTDGHCDSIGEVDYPVDLYTQTLGLRKLMRDFLHCRVANIWVPDTVAQLSPDCTSVIERLEKLKLYYSEDGVHLNNIGNTALSVIVKKIVEDHFAAPVSVSGRVPSGEFFWRGFVSPVGSSRPKNQASFHPGRSSGGGGGGGKWKTGFGAGRGGGRIGPMGPPSTPGRRR